jgi:hypothetical protein
MVRHLDNGTLPVVAAIALFVTLDGSGPYRELQVDFLHTADLQAGRSIGGEEGAVTVHGHHTSSHNDNLCMLDVRPHAVLSGHTGMW